MRHRKSRLLQWVGVATGIVTLCIVAAFLGAPVQGQAPCTKDSDCDDHIFCDGVETCVVASGICKSSGAPSCDDGVPCTRDFCDEASQGCVHFLTGDGESAPGPDGICHTADDNPALYGPDNLCGTGDDATGDGFCGAIDNCPTVWNPGQEDADKDGVGDACDPTPCPGPVAYVSTQLALHKIDLVTGNVVPLLTSLSEGRGLAIDPAGTHLFVAQHGSGELSVLDLNTLFLDKAAFGLSGPWGVALSPDGRVAYVTETGGGAVSSVNIVPGGGQANRIATGLAGPRGLAIDPVVSLGYVAEFDANRLSSVKLFGGGGPTPIASNLGGPSGVALNAAGTTAYVTEYSVGGLSAVNVITGSVSRLTAGLKNPLDLTLDPSGTIAYVTQENDGLVAVNLSNGVVTPVTKNLVDSHGVSLGGPAPVVVSLPGDAKGSPTTTVAVPVTLGDVTGRGVLSADLTIDWDATVLSASSATLGTLGSGCTLTSNLSVPGQAVLSVFCSTALVGSGPLVQINFAVIGARGKGTVLHFAAGTLNEGSPAACLDDGVFTVPVFIVGTVRYYRDATTQTEPSAAGVEGATINLFDQFPAPGLPLTPLATKPTGCDGSYFFTNLTPVRTYVTVPQKTDDALGAIDPFDAALNAQHVVGLITLTPNQRLAADVTGNGSLTSFDSAKIAQFSVGLISQFPVASAMGSDWVFVPVPLSVPNQVIQQPMITGLIPGSIGYTPLIAGALNQDYLGILFGDVSGNWVGPTCSSSSQPASLTKPATRTRKPPGGGGGGGGGGGSSPLLSLPDLTAGPGDVIRVPISAQGTSQAISFYLDLRFDPTVLRLDGVVPGAVASGFNLTANPGEAGRARIALFSSKVLGIDGEIAAATFTVVGKVGSSTTLSLSAYTVNEGRIPVQVKQGSMKVAPHSM